MILKQNKDQNDGFEMEHLTADELIELTELALDLINFQQKASPRMSRENSKCLLEAIRLLQLVEAIESERSESSHYVVH